MVVHSFAMTYIIPLFSLILRRNIDFFKDYYFIIKVKPLFMHDDKIICKNKMEIMCLLNWFKKIILRVD